MCGKLIRTSNVMINICVGKKQQTPMLLGGFNVCQPHFVTVCMHVSIYCVQNRKKKIIGGGKKRENGTKKNPLMIYLWRRVLVY